MAEMILDLDKYADVARRAVAEGQILLKNEKEVLPIQEGSTVSVFGRIQLSYYKSGTGSGGMVNVDHVTGILDALLDSDCVKVNQRLLSVYQEWEKTHPFNEGVGWGNEPWSQEEMPLSDELVLQAARESDYAIVIIGRTAGEDQDNLDHPGSYRLNDLEEDMLAKVRSAFDKMIVVLNVGNIMDMSFEDSFHPDAVLYAWQGGMIGGLGTVDVLTGKVNPSGKLPDTIAYKIEDYPSDSNFGNLDKDVYEEDIYVGYRYFETVAKDKVRYPFGFGLSYTSFTMETTAFGKEQDCVKLTVAVRNTGKNAGKEVVQVYASTPQGMLGKPARVLVAFAKTAELEPGQTQELEMTVPYSYLASYDETGVTGTASSYVMEKGEYVLFAGNSVRNVKEAGSFELKETKVLERLSQALAPEKKFRRMKPQRSEDGSLSMVYEEAPARKESPSERRAKNIPVEYTITGDQGYKLSDVKNGKVSMEKFIAQLSAEDLSCIIRGEGMGSPKVTAGTAAAFGGVSENLKNFGIPCGCCDDGPSGMRLDSGMKAFSLPNGTLLASTFNTELVEELYAFTGIEMVKNKVDALLGPGMNIHRHPLNGRNFEYFSEDPVLTGKMAAAQFQGMHRAGVTGTAKHFCANNQETKRHELNSVVSERALREIYLKGFEIAVKEGKCDSVMTTYGAVNGLWTAGSYDLNTVILREEWGFEGIVMTDWWAMINEEGVQANKTNFAAMARAQNDIYMVCAQSDINSSGDNTLASLEAGTLTLGELQRNAMNICKFLLNTHAYKRMHEEETKVEVIGENTDGMTEEVELTYHKLNGDLTINLEEVEAVKGSEYVIALDVEKVGGYRVQLTAKSDLSELAQMSVSLFYLSTPSGVFTFNGTGGEWRTIEKKVIPRFKYAPYRLYFAQNGLKLKEIKFIFDKPLEEIPDDIEFIGA